MGYTNIDPLRQTQVNNNRPTTTQRTSSTGNDSVFLAVGNNNSQTSLEEEYSRLLDEILEDGFSNVNNNKETSSFIVSSLKDMEISKRRKEEIDDLCKNFLTQINSNQWFTQLSGGKESIGLNWILYTITTAKWNGKPTKRNVYFSGQTDYKEMSEPALKQMVRTRIEKDFEKLYKLMRFLPQKEYKKFMNSIKNNFSLANLEATIEAIKFYLKAQQIEKNCQDEEQIAGFSEHIFSQFEILKNKLSTNLENIDLNDDKYDATFFVNLLESFGDTVIEEPIYGKEWHGNSEGYGQVGTRYKVKPRGSEQSIIINNTKEFKDYLKKRITNTFSRLYSELNKLNPADQYRILRLVIPGGLENEHPNIDKLSLSDLETVITNIQNLINAIKSGKDINTYMAELIQRKAEDYNTTVEKMNGTGVVSRNIFDKLDSICWLFGQGSVEGLRREEAELIQRLKECSVKGDMQGFNDTYKELTGVEFSVENIQKMENAIADYESAQLLRNLYYTGNVRTVKNEVAEYEGNNGHFVFNTRYTFHIDDEPDYENSFHRPAKGNFNRTELEKALYTFFGGSFSPDIKLEESNRLAANLTKQWIKNKIEELELENKSPEEKYYELEKEFLTEEIKKLEDRVPGYMNLDKYKQKVDEATKIACGENTVFSNRVNSLLSATETVRTLQDIAIFIACNTAFPGAASLLTSAIVTGLNCADRNTDGDKTNNMGIGKALLSLIQTYGFAKVGEFVSRYAGKITPQFIADNIGNFTEENGHLIVEGMAEGRTQLSATREAYAAVNATNSNLIVTFFDKIIKK